MTTWAFSVCHENILGPIFMQTYTFIVDSKRLKRWKYDQTDLSENV